MDRPERSPSRAQRRALVVIAVGLMLAMTTWFSTSAVLPELRARWELSTNASSLLVVVLQLGFVAGAVASAAFGTADRVRLRHLILVSAVLAAVANAAIVPIDRYDAAVVLRFMTGAFLAGVYPPALKLVATWFRTGRGAAMGLMVAALTVGSAAPHLLNGVGGAQWAVVMILSSLLTIAGGLVVAFFGRDGPHPFPASSFELRQAWRALRQRDVRLASVAYLGHMWELYAMWAWIALFLRDVLDEHGSSMDPSVVAFVVIAVGAPGSVLAGLAGERVGKVRSATVAMVMSGTAALVVAVPGLPLSVVLVVALVWGASVVADSAQFSAIVSERADQRYVGTALTAQLAFGFLLTVATMWLVPLVHERAGWWAAFALLAPGPLLGAWVLRKLDAPPRAVAVDSH
ncbi:MAG: MFS transporter [Acidimicrobiia bacterium]|nr:MFS transporter [Acidimicrobiia bacterium]